MVQWLKNIFNTEHENNIEQRLNRCGTMLQTEVDLNLDFESDSSIEQKYNKLLRTVSDMMEAIPNSVWVKDENGKCELSNDIFSIESELSAIHDSDLTVLESGDSQIFVISGKDEGNVRHVRVSKTPRFDENSNINGIVTHVDDVTDIHDYLLRLDELLDKGKIDEVKAELRYGIEKKKSEIEG